MHINHRFFHTIVKASNGIIPYYVDLIVKSAFPDHFYISLKYRDIYGGITLKIKFYTISL